MLWNLMYYAHIMHNYVMHVKSSTGN